MKKIIERRLSLKNYDTHIRLYIGLDGALLHSSTTQNILPILRCDAEDEEQVVHMIGLYCGPKSKPTDANEFLKMFVDETKEIVTNGFQYDEQSLYSVCVHGIICDAPGRAFVLCTKFHGGFHSCSKCEAKGKYYRSVSFPDTVSTLRTDEKFKAHEYNEDYQMVKLF